MWRQLLGPADSQPGRLPSSHPAQSLRKIARWVGNQPRKGGPEPSGVPTRRVLNIRTAHFAYKKTKALGTQVTQ